MSVRRHSVKQVLEVLVNQSVAANPVVEVAQLGLGRHVAVNQKIGHFEKCALTGELLDRVTAIAQDSFFTVDESDCRLGRSGVYETLVESVQTSGRVELGDVDGS